jgi:hypothetical protein
VSDIVERLLNYSKDDHERGCAGRCYDCSCGYDDKRDPLMVEAADKITCLRARVAELEEALRKITEYEIEEGCPCSACIHSAIASAALAKTGESNE